ncbi:MAG: hypothetical protein M3P50_07840, partial [Actinomycetota bacterium]|nr:hypothetical protein [Actinomycetota bacterium]
GCARAVVRLRLRGDRVASARVYAQAAQVELAGGDTVFLALTPEGWRIDAAGCRGRGDEPLECEVEA